MALCKETAVAKFKSKSTALILIDLQKGIVSMPLSPREGEMVAKTGSDLADRFRAFGAPVVLVNVAWSKDGGDTLKQSVDRPEAQPPGGRPTDWSDLVPQIVRPGDIHVTKHNWGAFYGTDLDVQLRRRGIKTVAIGGIATNIGVESTARQAHEHGYDVVIAEDATTSFSAEWHQFSVSAILPMISRVMNSADIELEAE